MTDAEKSASPYGIVPPSWNSVALLLKDGSVIPDVMDQETPSHGDGLQSVNVGDTCPQLRQLAEFAWMLAAVVPELDGGGLPGSPPFPLFPLVLPVSVVPLAPPLPLVSVVPAVLLVPPLPFVPAIEGGETLWGSKAPLLPPHPDKSTGTIRIMSDAIRFFRFRRVHCQANGGASRMAPTSFFSAPDLAEWLFPELRPRGARLRYAYG